MYISKKTYIVLFALLIGVYLLGFLFPLMDLDATEYAMVAFRMFARQDYIHIISRNLVTKLEYDYLDKPHLSFWMEALCYQIFGVKDWAYRIPSFLFTLLGTFSTYKLGKKLYSEEVGILSALFFFGSQAIILENHDARTDAILGGAVIFGIWQGIEFLNNQKNIHLGLGVLGIVLGVATKGMISVVVSGTAIFFWFLYAREWKRLWDIRWLGAIVLFFILLSPVLYAYYLQFDLHPEKLVKGEHHVSGIKFLLWSQSFERYAGQGEFVQYPEFSFFFHTYLWAFLPWSLLSYISIFDRGRVFWRTRFQKLPNLEFMTWGSGVFLFLLLSGMQYKMPHYINILFPFFSILLASFLINLVKDGRKQYVQILTYIQWFVILVLFILVILLNAYCFPLPSAVYWIIFALLMFGALYYILFGENELARLVLPSVITGIAVNLLLNGNFYPQLLQYQPGNRIADYVESHHIDKKQVYYFGFPSRSYDFYTQRTNLALDSTSIRKLAKSGNTFYLYVEKTLLSELKPLSLRMQILEESPSFRVTKLNIDFLNPKTRSKTLTRVALLKVN